jgi:hypothetical protein
VLIPVVVGQSVGAGTSAQKTSAALGDVVALRKAAQLASPPLPAGRILNAISFVN